MHACGEVLIIYTYQCMEILFWTWLTTLMRRLSPSLATIRGPGNFPFTVTMLLVWHKRVTFCSLIYKKKIANCQDLSKKKRKKERKELWLNSLILYINGGQWDRQYIWYIHQTYSAWLRQKHAQEGGRKR